MKNKASKVMIAGVNERQQSLYAILDEYGKTIYQVWENQRIIALQFELIN